MNLTSPLSLLEDSHFIRYLCRVRKERLDLFYAFTYETGNVIFQVSSEKAFQMVDDLTFAATRQRLDSTLYGSDAHTLLPHFLDAIRHAGEILHGEDENRKSIVIYEIIRQISF
jgi:hypothetical protein